MRPGKSTHSFSDRKFEKSSSKINLNAHCYDFSMLEKKDFEMQQIKIYNIL